MFNVMLDAFPEDYGGYLIRTDFRIGVQIALALADEDMAPAARAATALSLLYGNGVPHDLNFALEGLKWYMCGGEAEKENEDGTEGENDGEVAFNFDYDHMRIYTAILKAFKIDINTTRLHWFAFRAMLSDVGECAFSQIVGYRTKDTSGMPPKQRAVYARLKKKFAVPRKFSAEEESKISEFFDLLGSAKPQDNT